MGWALNEHFHLRLSKCDGVLLARNNLRWSMFKGNPSKRGGAETDGSAGSYFELARTYCAL